MRTTLAKRGRTHAPDLKTQRLPQLSPHPGRKEKESEDVMEYDNLTLLAQQKIQDILWAKSEHGKERTAELIDLWLGDHADEGWDADRWIEEAKNASL